MLGPSIAFSNVALELSGNEILRGIDLMVAAGTIHCLIGPNGGGKTSLARCLLGQMPHTGKISIEWPGASHTIGYVPQFLDFDKTLPVTVLDFMALVCQPHRPAFVGLGKGSRAQSEAALDRVGLNGKRNSRLGSLSGGERQRVLFAQALVPEPGLLLLDEPMTSMDEVGARIFVEVIRDLRSAGVTILWIAHDLAQVKATADAVSCINRSILFSGPPQTVLAEHSAEALFGQIGVGA
jgi:zinc transport system ATP-binding protein